MSKKTATAPAPVSAPPASAREFLPWVEAARTLLMAGVVLVHCDILAAPGVTSWWPFGTWSVLPLCIMVPSFMLISGFVFSLGDITSPGFDARRFVRRRVATLVIPFFAWNAIMIGLDVGLGYSVLLVRDEPGVVGQSVLHFFTGYWQMYFICALLQCIALLMLLRRFFAGRGLAAVVVVAALVSAAFYGASSWLFWRNEREAVVFLEIYFNRTFAPWVVYFFLGVFLAQRPAARAFVGRYWWLFAALSVAAFPMYVRELELEAQRIESTPILQFFASGFPTQVLGALAYVGLFQWLGRARAAERPLKAIAKLAPLSLGVYLCHNAILIPLHAAWVKHLPQHTQLWLMIPVLWVTVAMLAIALTAVGRRLGVLGRVLFVYRAPEAPKERRAAA